MGCNIESSAFNPTINCGQVLQPGMKLVIDGGD